MNGPGTLRIAFVYRDEQAGHPLERLCPPLPPSPLDAAKTLAVSTLTLATATALFDVASLAQTWF